MSNDFAAGKGGSYRINEAGELELVERTHNPGEPEPVIGVQTPAEPAPEPGE